MTNLYVGDAIVILKTAFDLYERGREAYNAPEDFRNLLEELRLIKAVLFPVTAQVRRNTTDRHNPVGDATSEALYGCHDALLSFKPIVDKYQKLANTDSGSWIRRFSWVRDQRELRECHKKFDKALKYLHLAHLALVPSHQSDSHDITPSILLQSGIRRQLTPSSIPSGNTCVPKSSSRDSDSSIPPRKAIPKPGTDSSSQVSEHRESNISPLTFSSAAEFGIGNRESSSLWYVKASENAKLPSHAFNPIAFTKDSPHSVPLRPERRRANLGSTIRSKLVQESRFFTSNADADVCLYHATWWLLKSRAWRKALADHSYHHDISPAETASWSCSISLAQAKADLYKSRQAITLITCNKVLMFISFILEDLILARDPYGSTMDDIDWIRLVTLADYIDRDLEALENDSTSAAIKDDTILRQDLSLSESWMSPAEDPKRVPDFIDNLRSPRRWIKAEMTDGGIRKGTTSDRRERVLFHTFVNAQLGDEQISMKSSTSPYLLILSYWTGRSEMFLSLCNLAFTVNLCKVLAWRDLSGLGESTRPDGGLEFDFTNQPAVLRFLTKQDHKDFLSHPERFFQIVRDREPRPGEMMVFRDTAEAYQAHDETTATDIFAQYRQMDKSFATPSKACEISLYDHCPEQSWKTTRRLVISSDPSTIRPWCMSHWLPLSSVRVEATSAKQITLRWSDYYHLDERPNGEYGVWYSCLYRPEKPNCSINITFREDAAARSFVDAILRPFDTPFKLRYVDLLRTVGSHTSDFTSQLYRLRDLSAGSEAKASGRLAVSVINKHPNNVHVTEMYFIHRDIDFEIADTTYSLYFPDLHVPDYHTTIRDVAKMPEEEYEEPRFQDVSTASSSLHLEFPSHEERRLFVSSITGWELRFCTRVRLLSLAHKWPFSSASHHKALVHVFEKISPDDPATRRLRVSARSTDEKEVSWLTVNISVPHRQGTSILFKNVTVERGDELDMIEMQAVNSSARSQVEGRHERRLSIVFKKNGDAHEFMDSVGSKLEDLQV